MKTIRISFNVFTQCSKTIEFEDDFELISPDEGDTWDEFCEINDDLAYLDLMPDSSFKIPDYDGFSVDVMDFDCVNYMSITDMDGNEIFEKSFEPY